jgi:predicted NBD/HSP70 family sugar kinase
MQERLGATDRDGATEPASLRGSNQSGLREHNERLVLSLVRRDGALSKSDIARMSGLSAQTVSVIMRRLESEGFLARGEPVKGRIGQPSIPLSLSPEGAYFLGLKIGRRSSDLALIDFLGRIVGFRRRTYRYPTPDLVVAFVAGMLPELAALLPPSGRDRIGGLGIAMPFQLWSWVKLIGAPQSEMDAWRSRDIQAEVAAVSGLPTWVQNDATAACGAELVFGSGDKPQDFLYFYLGYFIGGGLVLNGRLRTGRSGNAGGVAPLPVPDAGGGTRRLLEVASLSTLSAAVEATGGNADMIWDEPDGWNLPAPVLDHWIDGCAQGMATAILGASSLLELEAAVIDGWMPDAVRGRIVAATNAAFHRLDLSGIETPRILAGTVGAHARTLGAAAIPLSQRYLVE